MAGQYIPNYSFKEWRQIRQQYVEMPMSEQTARYLGVRNIEAMTGDSGIVIIDVNRKSQPFVRPL